MVADRVSEADKFNRRQINDKPNDMTDFLYSFLA